MTLVVEVDGVPLPDGALTIREAPNSNLPGGVAGLPLAAWYGEALTGGYVIDDPDGDYDFTGLHTIVAYETAATSRPFITGGWITGRRVSRGIYKDGPGRIHDVDFIDINWNYALMVFRASSAKRPYESDLARIQFIRESAPMAFTPSYDNGRFNITDNPVNFDEADLVKKYPIQAINEFVGIAGKNFYNYYDNAAEQISIHYDLIGVGPAAGLAISNVIADSDSTTLYPFLDAELDQGPAYTVTGILLGYRGAHAYGIRQATIDALSPSIFSPEEFQRDEMYDTDRVGRLATAESLIQLMLAQRAVDTDTIKVSIRVPAAQVNDCYPGEVMSVKFTHLPGYETAVDLPIIRRNVVPTAGRVDMYDIHLELSGQGVATGPGGGDPGEFPHEPADCNPSIVQTKAISDSLGGPMSLTPASPYTPGNLLVAGLYQRGDDTIIAPDGFTQVGTQVWDNRSGTSVTDQSCAMFIKTADSGDTSVVCSSEPSNAMWMAVTEVTGVNVALGDSATFEDDPHRTPPTVFTMPFGPLSVTAGGIIIGVGIIGTGIVDDSTATPQGGGVTLYHGTTTSGGPTRYMASKVVETDGTETFEVDWVGNSWGQGAIGAFFACAEGGSSLCPDAGVWVRGENVGYGDGTSDTFTTDCPFADGSLAVYVDRLPQTAALVAAGTDGATATFQLDFIPRTTELIEVDYQGR